MADSNTPKTATQGQWEDLASRIKSSGPTVVQVSGASTTDVMSQKATTDLVNGRVATNAGAPTTSTAGTVGQVLEDTTNGKLYICTSNTGGTYTWGEVGGSQGPTVVQVTGTSTTDVMSQNAVTSMVFADPSTKKMVQIGGTNIGSGDSVVVGGVSTAKDTVTVGNGAATAEGSVTLGKTATTGMYAKGAVALGAGSGATVQGVVSIGASSSQYNSYTYNNSGYRLISGVHDPQSANDAANKNYVDTSVSSKLSITLSTTDIGEGATLAANTLYGVYE